MSDVDPLLDLLRRSLESNGSVVVEGLGTFRRTPAGYDFAPETQPQVFIAYVNEDLKHARRLAEALLAAGCSPWLDKDKLAPGQSWPRAIQRAIETSDAFIACFSPQAISKRGQFQNELRFALDRARRFPLDKVFLIPVRLERCTIPHRISEQIQYVDLFPDWERGIKRVVRSIRSSTPLRSRVELR